MEMAALGLTNLEIARRLEVTTHAVKFHLGSIYRKLGVSNRTQAVVHFLPQRAMKRSDARKPDARKPR
jgi:two-component system response regulator DegU